MDTKKDKNYNRLLALSYVGQNAWEIVFLIEVQLTYSINYMWTT